MNRLKKYIKSINICGLRSFGKKQTINFTIPCDNRWGLNIIVGENSSGKSTILEAIKYCTMANQSNLRVDDSDRESNSKQGIMISKDKINGNSKINIDLIYGVQKIQ